MYFKPEMITAIVEGRKTQTRRVCKPGEITFFSDNTLRRFVLDPNGRTKWVTENDYSVCPGRGKVGVWWDKDFQWKQYHPIDFIDWIPLRIRLTAIWRERVTEISEEDARAEGYPFEWPADLTKTYEVMPAPPRVWYAKLWDRINTRKGTRWADSPDVWALSFEVVK